jgi:Tol biopolymer transport system component
MSQTLRLVLSLIISLFLLISNVFSPTKQVYSQDNVNQDLTCLDLPDKANPKLDSYLNQLIYRNTPAKSTSADKQNSVQLIENQVTVVIECVSSQVLTVKNSISSLSSIKASYMDSIQAEVSVSNLLSIAEIPGIKFIRQPHEPVMEAITSEGIPVIHADDWHTAGYTGTNIKIAILDGGFDGYTDRIDEGELPSNLITQWFRDDGAGTSIHGTACAEIIYDIAPDAQIYLVSMGTDIEMGAAVDWLIQQDVDVISFSMGFLGGGPGDGTGPICDIVNQAYNAGILWVNAAGNHAQRHWSGSFVDIDNDKVNEFIAGDEGNTVSVSSGQTITATLTWNDPWYGSSNDYELLLLNNQSQIVAYSDNIQDGDDTPFEWMSYTAASSGAYSIAIAANNNPAPRVFHLYSATHSLEYQVASSSLSVPADSSDALTVGAIAWNKPDTLETFSSQGPTTDSRIKPDIVGPDGVSTASYGTSFRGTSASTPHVAGAAALVKNTNPTFSPAQIASYLENTAIESGGAGKDNLFGSGRVRLPWPLAGGKIAFTSNRNGTCSEIYVMNYDGSNQTRLTFGNSLPEGANDWNPDLSPDGTRIVFVSDRDGREQIYSMNTDGSGVVRLTNSHNQDYDPAWSPDGDRIAFTSRGSASTQIYVMNSDGSDLAQITTNGGAKPSWSPDSTKIAFLASRTGINVNIYSIDVDGTHEHLIISEPSAANCDGISWSPYGNKIVYDLIDGNNNSLGLYIVNADGSERISLPLNEALRYACDPCWSPDNLIIVFATTRTPPLEIFAVKSNGSDLIQLTDTAGDNSQPSWTVGDWIAPLIESNLVTDVSSTSVILHGTLSDKGSGDSVSLSFDWGIDTNYTGGNAPGAPSSLDAPGTFAASLTGLSPGQTYHYRAKAVGDGTAFGPDLTFTTQYALTIQVQGHGTVISEPDQTGYNSGETVQLTANPATGWSFSQWMGNLTGSNNPDSLTMDSNKMVSANFTINKYTVAATVSGGHGSVNPGIQAVEYESNASVAIIPESGYHIVSIKDNDIPETIVNPYTISHVKTNHSIVITFAIDAFTITATAGAGGVITPNGVVGLSQDDDQTFQISSDTGYHTNSLIIDGSPITPVVNTYTFKDIQANHTIEANFALNSYIVTASVTGGHGTVDPFNQVVNFGATGNINIIPDTGYKIESITDNGNVLPVANPCTIENIAANHEVIVTFAREKYFLTINQTGQGSISVNPEEAFYYYGDEVVLNAAPAGDYTFTAWSGDLSNNNNPVTVVINSNKNITAIFTAPILPVPFPVGGEEIANSGAGSGAGSSDRTYLTQYMSDTPGIFSSELSAKSWDGLLRLTLPAGTSAKTVEGWGLSYIVLQPIPQTEQTLAAPDKGNIVGLTYKLEPEGATFTPPITLNLLYKDEQIPSGVNEKDLVIGYWDTTKNQWVVLEGCVVDATNNTITAPLSHFSTYAVLYIPPKVTPASFSISNLNIYPLEAQIGDEVSIAATISNTGGSSGAYTAIFKINNVQVDSREVTLEAGKTSTIEFRTKGDKPGDYIIEINSKTGQFTIIEPIKIPPESITTPEPVLTTQPVVSPEPIINSEPSTTSKPAPTPQSTTSTPEPKLKSITPVILLAVCLVAVIGLISTVILLGRRRKT